jgi:hypothetical protein
MTSNYIGLCNPANMKMIQNFLFQRAAITKLRAAENRELKQNGGGWRQLYRVDYLSFGPKSCVSMESEEKNLNIDVQAMFGVPKGRSRNLPCKTRRSQLFRR